MTFPLKSSKPLKSGLDGIFNAPTAITHVLALYVYPAVSFISHIPSTSSNTAEDIVVLYWVYSCRLYFFAHFCKYPYISCWPPYMFFHSGLGSKENEYKCDGTSHAAPGYTLSRHTPPTSLACSNILKFVTPDCFNLMPSPMPPNPAPTMATSRQVANSVCFVSFLCFICLLTSLVF